MKHLIHIGFAKTGSSFLRRWFTEHPQIAYTRHGIAGFADGLDIAREASFPSGIRVRVTSVEGLATPHPYLGINRIDYEALKSRSGKQAQAISCQILHEIFPSATILIVTRGFATKILSAYSQILRTGGNLSFAAIASDAAQLTKWWDYDYLIGLYEEAFGRDRILVLPFELLRDDQDSFLATIAQHLGLDPFATAPTPDNPSISRPSLAWYAHFATFVANLPASSVISRLYRRFVATDQLAPVAAILQRICPLPVPNASDIPETLLVALGNRCECLRDRPEFRNYLRDYFISGSIEVAGETTSPPGSCIT